MREKRSQVVNSGTMVPDSITCLQAQVQMPDPKTGVTKPYHHHRTQCTLSYKNQKRKTRCMQREHKVDNRVRLDYMSISTEVRTSDPKTGATKSHHHPQHCETKINAHTRNQ